MTPVLEQLRSRVAAREPVQFAPSGPGSPPQSHAYHEFSEVKRIIGIPIYGWMTPEELEEYNRQNVLASAFNEPWRLFPIQAEAVSSYETGCGILGPIGVGHGKTLVTLMIAEKAYASGIEKIVLLVPPEVLCQLLQTDIRWARTRVPISYPICCLGGLDQASRRALARSTKRGLFILPYSLLSTKDTDWLLSTIAPGLLIADEAHRISRMNAARTNRIKRYVEANYPKFVALSGTLTSKTIQDYYHLAKWALRDNNPLPNATSLARDWAVILDSTDNPADTPLGSSEISPLLPLVEWAKKHFPASEFPPTVTGFRRAYQARLTTTPGVVASGDTTIKTSLTLHNEPVPADDSLDGWRELQELQTMVETQWLTPNGDEIEHAIHMWKWLNELTAGFFNELTWPTPDSFAHRKKTSPEEASDILERAKLYHAAGQQYAKALRSWLERYAKPGLDTPMLVGQSMSQHGSRQVGDDLYEPWLLWKDLDFPNRPERDSRAVRVCSYKIDAAARWVTDVPTGCGALVWYFHQEIGIWLTEALRATGRDVLHCPAGNEHNEAILAPSSARRIVVASIPAHGTGKNLQAFQHQYFVQWPRSAVSAEQTVGRTHRMGQKADELVVCQNFTTLFDQLNFAACLNDALYIQQTTGNRQKLIYSQYDPLPKIFPSAILHERGYQNRLLTKQQETALCERFMP